MGILDDAIREHLDLKRRQGAAEDELARLEDEAFGPPTRPGDPDFERPQDAGEGAESTAVAATEAPAVHDQDTGDDLELLEGTFEEEPALSEAATIVGEPAVDAHAGTDVEAGDDEVLPAGEATVEHDTLAEPGEVGDLDLDIDLRIDEEIEKVGGLDLGEDETSAATTTPAADPELEDAEDADDAEAPIESMETVEHHFDGALDEAEVVEDDEVDVSLGDADEDVLEETPEFLRDAPEDDELWFEQGEPKDFDF